MNTNKIINDAKEKLSEYLEMEKNPDKIVCIYLAGQMISMQNQIDYLTKRLNYATTTI